MAGYGLNAALVAATEALFLRMLTPKQYFVADLTSQCVIEVAAGYVCARIAPASRRRFSTLSLIALGWIIGVISLITSWQTEPHWYGIALLVVWGPFVWLGYLLQSSAAETDH